MVFNLKIASGHEQEVEITQALANAYSIYFCCDLTLAKLRFCSLMIFEYLSQAMVIKQCHNGN